ncbi:MAG: hypothetical protein U9R79_13780 [Armatimonadota bacterium]|nr:hypothetical protein [Armatimonadota bacterium]
MSGRGVGGGVAVRPNFTERVAELDRRERQAIAGGEWERLDEILQRQKALWRELRSVAEANEESQRAHEAREALRALYHVRRRNHGRIERCFADLKRRLAAAQAGSDARAGYRETAGLAA